jgi:hypothetical protein
MTLLCYRRHRFPPEIIQHAIWQLRWTPMTLRWREPDSNHRSRVTQSFNVASGWFPANRKVGVKENRHTKRRALPPRNRWFESLFPPTKRLLRTLNLSIRLSFKSSCNPSSISAQVQSESFRLTINRFASSTVQRKRTVGRSKLASLRARSTVGTGRRRADQPHTLSYDG